VNPLTPEQPLDHRCDRLECVPPALVFGGECVADRRERLIWVEPHRHVADDARTGVDRQLYPVVGGRPAETFGVVDQLVGEIAGVGEWPVLES